ncbi:response regulator [Mariniflexile ostreae]|uniref:Response regulator n=1 Tax=Mariniflexile ostreae TaxID=1520892 RepID=A0ABV5F7Z4_9FLAO
MNLKEVLLIDDNSIDNYINQYIVEKANVAKTITIKSSPIEALEYLKNKEDQYPELIFLDIKMPEMDGFGFLEIFGKFMEEKKINTHIIMLTSSHNVADIEKSNNNPYVKKYLIKPLDTNKLGELLKEFF